MKFHMWKAFAISFVVTFSVILALRFVPAHNLADSGTAHPSWWEVQSIDTMKYSRDLSREKINDISFNAVINTQMEQIAKTGATHVGIATPYDEEFIPILTRWIHAARKHNLKVWFRGNFSGWEQWFEYKAISRQEHIALLSSFISSHPELFSEGDIFTPCPECENGGPGDPRKTGDIEGHRLFLIQEYTAATDAFRRIGIGVRVGYFSMNYDVANVIMDKSTTESVGGIVTIDHYVASPEKLITDIRNIAKQSGGQVFLGEFGAPIPDIHGDMSETQQSEWLSSAFSLLSREPAVIGINYWVNMGGSTQLWSEDGTARKAVDAVSFAFTPAYVSGKLINQINKPIANKEVLSQYKKVYTDASGQFIMPYLPEEKSLHIDDGTKTGMTVQINDLKEKNRLIIEKQNLSLLERIIAYFIGLTSNFR